MKNIFVALFFVLLFSGCSKDDPRPAVVSFEEQLAIDEEKIADYLAANNIDAEIDDSGISYVINSEGTGENPSVGDRIAVKYKSFNLEETSLGIDTIGLTIDLTNEIIESWTLMVPRIKEGGRITIYSPSGYVFGATGSGSIPPNEIVIFEIEIIAIINTEEKQFSIDEEIIDEYLAENKIPAVIHTSGIRYVVLEEGTGDVPVVTDNVFITYEGTLLSGFVFDGNDTGTVFNLQQLIEAWQIMLPTMKEGGKIKFYAPSEYCYGTLGTTQIPPYTILTFEIDLIDIQN